VTKGLRWSCQELYRPHIRSPNFSAALFAVFLAPEHLVCIRTGKQLLSTRLPRIWTFLMALSATSSTTSTSPAILYPTGLPVINWLDTVVVLYETPWTALANLSLNCFITPAAAEYYWQVAGNPSTRCISVIPFFSDPIYYSACKLF
jgi:hypothetical protein